MKRKKIHSLPNEVRSVGRSAPTHPTPGSAAPSLWRLETAGLEITGDSDYGVQLLVDPQDGRALVWISNCMLHVTEHRYAGAYGGV